MALTPEQQDELEAIEFGIAECEEVIAAIDLDGRMAACTLAMWRSHLANLRARRNALLDGET